MYCTPGRAKKVVIVLTIVAMTSTAIGTLVQYTTVATMRKFFFDTYAAVYLVLPLSVLVVNLLVVCEVRRASSNASTNLGLQQSQQTTSSNSAVPTVMLITTSLVYVFLGSTWAILHIYSFWFRDFDYNEFKDLEYVYNAAGVFQRLIFAYNFFVYLITGRQFRSELRSLCCCCCCCTSVVAAGRPNDDAPAPRSGQLMATSVWNVKDDHPVFILQNQIK